MTDPETGRPSSGDGLTVIGFTHQTCPASIRERLYMEDDEAGPVEAAIRDAGCEAAMVLSTCDRVDLVVQAGDEGAVSVERVTERLTAAAGFEAGLVLPYRHVMAGPDAFRYLARVAAGMESQIIGEAQVLGQLKAAHRRAEAAGHVTGRLSGALQAAYRAAKRVRSETAIGEESVSLASTAVDLVHQLHGDLTGLSGVLVGAGDMGLFLVDALTRAGLSRWTVVGRSDRRARALAHQVGAADRAILDDLAAVLDRGDVVVTALGDGPETLSAERVEGVLRRRRRRPMFFLDVGVPGDVEAAVHRLDDAFVYSLDDLSALAEEGLQKRRASLEAADRIIAEETMRFETERAERSAVPAIQALTRKLDALKKEAAGDDPAPEVAAALDRFASRLLHHPATALRMAAAQGDGLALEGAVRKLFKLDESESRNEDKNEES
ncbi:MAG: glutamyl-tRNA reductase [Alphaproteobacteria bacterium]|nr:glutamyl-tRNA reductase [Alphaproteobacteria bacterium]